MSGVSNGASATAVRSCDSCSTTGERPGGRDRGREEARRGEKG